MTGHTNLNEEKRIADLIDHEILDTPPSAEFDDLVRLAALICGTPIAAVTLIDSNRQWFKAITGIVFEESSRDISFCAHTILQDGMFVIPDTTQDSRFVDNPLVAGGPKLRFYAGIPLYSDDGNALGSLCVIDLKPRNLTADQTTALHLLARQAAAHLASAHCAAQLKRIVMESTLAQRALRLERDFQNALVESLHDGIIACDANGSLTLVNQASQDFHPQARLPVSPDGWATHFDLYYADDSNIMRTQDVPLYRAMQGEIVSNFEVLVLPEGGIPRLMMVNARPIVGADGTNLGAVVAMRDVTERRQVERDNERLAAIVEHSDDGIFATSMDGIILSWNNGAERVFGFTQAEVLGRRFSVLDGTHEQVLTREVIDLLGAGRSFEPIEVARTRKDSAVIDISLSFSPIKNVVSDVVGISCIVRDITARKRTETALAESEVRLRRLSDAALEGIAITQDGLIIDANAALVDEFGFDNMAQMIGLPVQNLAIDESSEIIRLKVESGDEEPYEATLCRKDGTSFIAEIRGRYAIYNGRPARITAVRNVTEQRKMAIELLARETKLRALLESAPIILYTVDAKGIVTFSEGAALSAIGIASGEAVGRSVFDYAIGNETLSDYYRRALAGEAVSYDSTVFGPSFHTQLQPIVDGDDRPAGFIGVSFDVTERIASEERFRAVFEQSSHAHVIFDEVDGIIDCNEATLKMMRCERNDLIGKAPALLSPELQPDGNPSGEKGLEMQHQAILKGVHVFEWQHRALDGHEYPVEVTLTLATLNGKSVLLAVWHDLTERKMLEKEMRRTAVALQDQRDELAKANIALAELATVDYLTGLNNRRVFQERLAEEVARANRYATPLSIIILDVDHFKEHNDTFGHLSGDDVLRTVGSIIQAEARDTDTSARYGGEEFVLILPMTNLRDAEVISERIRKKIEWYDWKHTQVTASLGVSSLDLLDVGEDALVQRADAALYESKLNGRNRVCSNAYGSLSDVSRTVTQTSL